VASLIARSPAKGLLPVTLGMVTLSEETPEAITSLTPLRGAEFALPAPNRARDHAGGRLLWSGRGQALLVGPAPEPIAQVAMTDQSDAWAVLRLEGRDSAAVLARLTPLDLRPSAFEVGHVARSLLGHMHALFEREAPEGWRLFVSRSMTGSAVHDLTEAMRSVAARSAL
jgi:sarcosine oxidase subunit gamma